MNRYGIKLFFTLILLSFIINDSFGSTMDEKTSNSDKSWNKYFNKKGFFLLEKFLSDIKASGDKGSFADGFLKYISREKYPLFENDTAYVLLYKGKQDTVGILGDMTNWTDIKQMRKIENTDLFYIKGTAEPDARFEYWLMFSKDGFPSVDTLSQYKALNGFGELSELAMPGYKRHPYFDEYIHGEKGKTDKLLKHEIPSRYLGYSHELHVYLPDGYDAGKKYPVVYFQDGIDYIEFAQAHAVIEKLIKDGKIMPLIGVFVTPPNRLKPGTPNRMTEYGMNDDYVKFFASELVPFIDSAYSTIKDPAMRLVTGDSYGGLISAYIPFARPDVFGNGYSQSGYLSFSSDRLIKMYSGQERKPIKLYVDSGIYERNVGASFLPAAETDFLLGNRRFNKVLGEKSYKFVYREYPEGHAWGNWRRHLIDALIYFFPIQKAGR